MRDPLFLKRRTTTDAHQLLHGNPELDEEDQFFTKLFGVLLSWNLFRGLMRMWSASFQTE